MSVIVHTKSTQWIPRMLESRYKHGGMYLIEIE